MSKFFKACALLGVFGINSAYAQLNIDVMGPYEINLEGLFQADTNRFNNDARLLSNAPLSATQRVSQTLLDDSNMRRAELILRGKGEADDFIIGFDARQNRWLDVNYRRRIGAQFLRIGQTKQPNSFEELMSTRHNDFVAKASITSAFAIARRLGVELAGGTDRWAYQVSAFGRELDNPGQRANGYGGRLTYAPIYEINETFEALHAVHLGLSFINFDPTANTVRLTARPEADFANIRLIDSANLTDADGARQYGAEAAYFLKNLKLQAEYVDADYARQTRPTYSPEGYYLSAVYNVTGEKFVYRNGLYTTPPPLNFSGMVQLTARFSHLNANSGGVFGGKQDIATIGANLYLRNNFKLMLNQSFVDGERGAFSNDPNILEFRAQFHF
jgi:phosphate-selective porin OprO and OprP